ncbi:IS4 family transposase [bacterium]|nr:IS4 family transposase [bacterium]
MRSGRFAKRKTYAPLKLTVIHADERGMPRDREAIHWKLATNLSVPTLDSAIEKLDWYAQRWKIETFHKVLKSGCRAEASRLQTAERLTDQLSVFCITAWRVFCLTMINRSEVTPPVTSVFTPTELTILEQLAQDSDRKTPDSISDYITAVARLGGYLARGKDPPPGNTVLWRGLSRLTDIQLGFELVRRCG